MHTNFPRKSPSRRGLWRAEAADVSKAVLLLYQGGDDCEEENI